MAQHGDLEIRNLVKEFRVDGAMGSRAPTHIDPIETFDPCRDPVALWPPRLATGQFLRDGAAT